MMDRVYLAFAFLLLVSPLQPQAPPSKPAPSTSKGTSNLIRWIFREDFSHGIPGWMSFPLAQDVGYDPSLYTAREEGETVLVRDVTAQGERRLAVGLLRPLRFHAAPASTLRIFYKLAMCGQTSGVRLTLAAVDGRKYSLSLPAAQGAHDVRVDGRRLKISLQDVEVEVVTIEADVTAPVLGSHNRLTLREFEVEGERPASLPSGAPDTERSYVSDIAVARSVFGAARPLVVRLGPGQTARAAIYDGTGALSREEDISAGRHGSRQVNLLQPAANTPSGLWKAEITSGPARSEFRFLVLGEVPAHPRILLAPARLEQLHNQAGSNELLAIVRRRARELRATLAYNPDAGENIAQLSRVSVFPGLVEYFALMENYSNAIAFNALDFRINGDREALDAARRGLLTVAQWSTWTPAWFSAHGLHTYYEVGVFTQRVALGYDLIADQLSQKEKSPLAEAFLKNSIRPTLDEYFFFDRMSNAASNHMANSVGGAIAACVALLGDVPDWEDRFGTALAELIVAYEHLVDGLFPGDGSEAEPAGYGNFAMEGMSWGLAALRSLSIRPRGTDKVSQSYWWLRYVQVKPDLMLDTGDFHGGLRALSGFAWGAENAGDPSLRAFYDTATDRSLMGHTGRTLEEAPGLLDLACCTGPSIPVVNPPPSRIFPLRGSAVLRSGWQPDDTVISIRVGPWFNHQHHDQGSFQVAAGGEELIDEAGYADYYKDPHYQDYFTQAPAHNTVLVDNDAFSQGSFDGRTWRAFQNFPKFTRHVFSRGIDYLAADLTSAYGGVLDGFTREFLFIKPDILILRDRLRAASPRRYSWLLHAPLGAQTNIDTARALIRGKAAIAALTAGAQFNRWTLERTLIPTAGYGDLDRVKVQPRQALRLDSPADKETDFLVGMRFQKASDEPCFPRAVSGTEGHGFSIREASGDATVFFRAGGGPLTAGEISSDGDALAFVVRDGLKEIFAGNARTLRRGRQLLVSSNQAIDLVLRTSPSVLELQFVAPRESSLKILVGRSLLEVKLDQSRVAVTPTGGLISLPRITPGEHIVTVNY